MHKKAFAKKTPLRIVNIELASTDKTWKLDDNVKLSPIAKWCGKKCRPFYKFTYTWWRFLWLLPLPIRCSYSYSWILHRNKTITFNTLWFIPSKFSSAKKLYCISGNISTLHSTIFQFNAWYSIYDCKGMTLYGVSFYLMLYRNNHIHWIELDFFIGLLKMCIESR